MAMDRVDLSTHSVLTTEPLSLLTDFTNDFISSQTDEELRAEFKLSDSLSTDQHPTHESAPGKCEHAHAHSGSTHTAQCNTQSSADAREWLDDVDTVAGWRRLAHQGGYGGGEVIEPESPAYSCLFKKYELVVSRELSRLRKEIEKTLVLSSSPKASPSALSHLTTEQRGWKLKKYSRIPPSLRFGVLSMFPLIETIAKIEQTSCLQPELKSKTLKILLNILQTSPPLALEAEQGDTFDDMMYLLESESAASETTDTPAGRPQSNEHKSAQSGERTAGRGYARIGVRQSELLSARIGLALQRGSLKSILASLLPLLRQTSAGVDVSAYVLQLLDYQKHLTQPQLLFREELILDSWSHESSSKSPNDVGLVPARASYARITSDGRFLYVDKASGLYKIGTGLWGTIRGKIYRHRALVSSDFGWIVSWRDTLIYRSRAAEFPKIGTELCTETLKTISVFVSLRANLKRIPEYCHLTTDGHSLLLLRRVNGDFFVDFYVELSSEDAASRKLPRENSEGARIRYVKCVRSVSLPPGWTQLPEKRYHEVDPDKLTSRFCVGQKVDAKDPLDKWYHATVMNVTPSRVFVSYDDWSSKWDEWIDIDSKRLATRDARAIEGDGPSSGPIWSFGDAKEISDVQNWTDFTASGNRAIENAYRERSPSRGSSHMRMGG
eukprot:175578_1